MKKVLIITYYWPPMGGGGVQRWLKFTKYLREFGWEPVIYTPENAEIANKDEGLLKDVPEGIEVVRRPIWEPFDLYKVITGKSKEEKVQPGFLQESDGRPTLQKLSVWIRGNLFIPDAKKFWINPSVRFLKSYLKKSGIQTVISTGPPHSNHMIALKLKDSMNIRWLADFRDPWTNIDYYNKLMLSKWADARHRKLEKDVFRKADEVVTVSYSWAKDFQTTTGRLPLVVTNGYDEEDFKGELPAVRNEKMVITHIGSLNADRCPNSFFEALGRMKQDGKIKDSNLVIRFIGPTDISVFRELKKRGIQELAEHIPQMPHGEVIKELFKADILLLPLNNTPNIGGVVPGKLYEYLASQRPILCIGKKDGDSAKIIGDANAGVTFDFEDSEGIEAYLGNQLSLFASGGISSNSKAPEKFSRRLLAREICTILSRISV